MLFDSTLRRDLLRTFGATLAVILTIVLTMFLIRTLGQAAVGRVSPQDVVLLLGFTALAHLPTMLSLSLFIAVVITLGRMYRESEMTIWFASGVGLLRFVRPVLRTFWPALLLVTLLLLVVWPWVNERSNALKERFEQRSDLSRVAPGQFQSSRDGKRVFFIERDGEDGRTGRNVFILTNSGDVESVTTARNGHIDNSAEASYLVLDKGQRNEHNQRTGEKTVSRFESYRVQTGERARTASGVLPPKARSTLLLLQEPDAKNRGELTWRVGLALGAANLLLLGLGLSAANPRRASNWNLLFALLSFVVYYNLINLSQAWVASGKLSMGSALAVIHGGALAMGLLLLWWRDHGTHWQGWGRLRRSPTEART
jgi:lipopolysaccharide export system permease protein